MRFSDGKVEYSACSDRDLRLKQTNEQGNISQYSSEFGSFIFISDENMTNPLFNTFCSGLTLKYIATLQTHPPLSTELRLTKQAYNVISLLQIFKF